jgi:glycoprotein J
MYHHNNIALARALAPEAPRSRPSIDSQHGRFSMKTRRRVSRRLRAVALGLAAIAALAPATALALPGHDAPGAAASTKIGDTPATFPGASRAAEYEAPTTLQVVRPERTIVRDADRELPIILAGLALAIALGGAGYVLVRTRTLQRRLTH